MKLAQEKPFKKPETKADWKKAEETATFKPTESEFQAAMKEQALIPDRKRLIEEFGEGSYQSLGKDEHGREKWRIKASGRKALKKVVEMNETRNRMASERVEERNSKIAREDLVNERTGQRYVAPEFLARQMANTKGLVPGRRRTYFFGRGSR